MMFLNSFSAEVLRFKRFVFVKKLRKEAVPLSSSLVISRLQISSNAAPAEEKTRGTRRLITWNVNSLRSLVAKQQKSLTDLLQTYDPYLLCMQEVKLQKPILKGAEDLFQRFSFHEFHLSIARKGYSGVAVFAKEAPNEFFCGFAPGISLDDTEGRLMTLAYDDFTLVNIYVPNSGVQLQRLGYRTEAWDKGFQEHLKTLRSMYNRPLVVCGDFNVARTAIDLNDPFNNERSACYTIEERNNFELLLSETGLVDAYRFLNGNVRGQYTYWSYRGRSRQRNNGWRIDYFLVDASLIHPEESECIILKDVLGSDHAPVMFTLQG